MSVSLAIVFILFAPLIGGVCALFAGRKVAVVSSMAVVVSFFASLFILFTLDFPHSIRWEWLPGFSIGILLDKVTLLLICLVTFISGLVHVFSMDYMKEDGGINRFYAKLGLFVFSMIGLLLADHLILLFVFWELVGVSSYLLIGFWYRKDGVPSSARMAFMVNRVADVGLLAGILMVWNQSGNLFVSEIDSTIWLIPSLLISIGAFGKSAQFPFSGWLTKAMVGPTPVSALIHAATMVAAGVYLLFRMAPLLHSDAMVVIAVIGAITALYGGLSALNQHYIKKVLAYSTISQLGYMMIGIGVGARDAALLHLFTHAFFKAGLFLGAASIIHYLHRVTSQDAQDMRMMGGLRNVLPWTFRSFLVCALALAGVPFFSGFLSKEGIIIAAWEWANEMGTWAYLIPDLALIAALLTAFYIGRTVFLVFLGNPRGEFTRNAETETNVIVVPLIALGLFSLWIFFGWNPIAHDSWLSQVWGAAYMTSSGLVSGLVTLLSIILATAGFAMAYSLFRPNANYTNQYHLMENPASRGGKMLFSGFYLVNIYKGLGEFIRIVSKLFQRIDRKVIDPFLHLIAIGSVVFSKGLALFDRFAIDGPVNWSASLSRFVGKRFAGLSSRDSQTQLIWLMVALILILGWIILF